MTSRRAAQQDEGMGTYARNGKDGAGASTARALGIDAAWFTLYARQSCEKNPTWRGLRPKDRTHCDLCHRAFFHEDLPLLDAPDLEGELQLVRIRIRLSRPQRHAVRRGWLVDRRTAILAEAARRKRTLRIEVLPPERQQSR